jgi:hypothetical protein
VRGGGGKPLPTSEHVSLRRSNLRGGVTDPAEMATQAWVGQVSSRGETLEAGLNTSFTVCSSCIVKNGG